MKDRLLTKLKKHDEKALEAVMEKYSRLVATVIYNISKDSLTKEDIEETVADVFVTLWNNADKVQEGKLKGYICSIARTRTLNKIAVNRKKLFSILMTMIPRMIFQLRMKLRKRIYIANCVK